MGAQPFSAYFPLVPNGKTPAGKEWQHVQSGQARTTRDVGINLQADELIVDVDAYKPEGAASLEKLKVTCPQLFDSYTVKTPRGGYHFYTMVPGDRPIKQKQSGYPGVEFQNGVGTHRRYAVAHGSVTPDGTYQAVKVVSVINLPKAFLETLEAPKERDEEDRINQPSPSLAGEPQFIADCQTWKSAVDGQGGSNVTFALAARGTRNLNLPLETVFNHMRDIYNPRCQPAWSDTELWHKVEDGYKDGKESIGCALVSSKFAPDMVTNNTTALRDGEPPKVEVPITGQYNHLGLAARFVQEYGRYVRWCNPLNSWLVWGGKCWEADNERRPQGYIQNMSKKMYAEAVTDKELGFAHQCGLAPFIKGALETAKPYLSAPAETFDRKLHLLNLKNGTLDLTTGELRKHDPTDHITKYSDVDYDPEAGAPHWEKFIKDIFPNENVANFVQRVIGSAISGRGCATDQKLYIAHGDGQNGKSTFFNAVHGALGGYAHETDHALLTAQKKNGPNEGMANLRGKRLCTTIETAEDDWLNETTVKHLTGGDPVTCRALYQGLMTFMPTHTLFMVTNHLPKVKSQGFAVWRRIVAIPFTVRIADDKKDPRLSEKLQQERAGILAWIVRGHQAWLEGSLRTPPEVLAETERYKVDQDELGSFLQNMCDVDPSTSTQASLMVHAYKTYCDKNGIDKPLHRDSFPKRMEEKFKKIVRSGYTYWVGVKLKPTESEADRAFATLTPPVPTTTAKSWSDLI
jgi:putative DNA primase/helicase